MVGVFVAVQIENISTENGGRSESVVAGSDRGDFGLIFLEADFHVSVALVPGAVQVLGAFYAIAAFPIEQLAVYIPHRVKLQLEIARGPGHLKIKAEGETASLLPRPGAAPAARCCGSPAPRDNFPRLRV